MTTVYASKHSARVRKWTKRRIGIVAGVVVGSVALSGVAWAAYQLYGFGTLDAAAATTQGLTVNNSSAQLTNKLVPGQTVGAKAAVTNPNDFPVVVTGVIVRNSTLSVTPNTADCQSSVHAVGTATTWPGEGGGAATLQAIPSNITIAPGQSAWITVPQAVKQDASATTLCGVHAEFAVRAQTPTS